MRKRPLRCTVLLFVSYTWLFATTYIIGLLAQSGEAHGPLKDGTDGHLLFSSLLLMIGKDGSHLSYGGATGLVDVRNLFRFKLSIPLGSWCIIVATHVYASDIVFEGEKAGAKSVPHLAEAKAGMRLLALAQSAAGG